MSAPRCVLPGVTYLITRRCSERRFFLRPAPDVNAIVRYCLALAAHRHGVALHAVAVLANHYHLVATDTRGQLPRFMHDFDLAVARALNARHAHFESLWAPGSYSAVALADTAAVVDKIAYTLANPVAAGLVRRGDLWPGVISRPSEVGARPRDLSRPPRFFRRAGPRALPATVALALAVPPGLEHLALEKVRALLAAAVTAREEEARRARQGRPFLGRRGVLHQRVEDHPRDPAPRFRLHPRVAGRDQGLRIEAVGRLRRFLAAYRRAWEQLKAGVRAVVFPAGTWKLRHELGVRCEAPS